MDILSQEYTFLTPAGDKTIKTEKLIPSNFDSFREIVSGRVSASDWLPDQAQHRPLEANKLTHWPKPQENIHNHDQQS